MFLSSKLPVIRSRCFLLRAIIGDTSQANFVVKSDWFYQGYDISCFTCADSTTVVKLHQLHSPNFNVHLHLILPDHLSIPNDFEYPHVTSNTMLGQHSGKLELCMRCSFTCRTICPVTQSHQTSSKKPLLLKPTPTPSRIVSIPIGYTISIIYQASVETFMKCPAVLTTCLPVSVITKTIAVSTTICPITQHMLATSPSSAPVTKSSTNSSQVPGGISTITVLSLGGYQIQGLQLSSANLPFSDVSIQLSSSPTSGASGSSPHSTLLPVFSFYEIVKPQYSSVAGDETSFTSQPSTTGTSAGSTTSAPVQVSVNTGAVVGITWSVFIFAVGLVAVL